MTIELDAPPPAEPPTITANRAGSGHRYAINGEPVKGVTTLIKGGVPAPALMYWAADETARFAVEHPELITKGGIRAWDRIRRSPWKERDRKAVRGTKVHAYAEALVRGDRVEVAEPELVGYVDACLSFFTDHEVKPLHSEATVASVRWMYAGTMDLIADSIHGLMLVDYKTTGAVYVEAALQLAAYRHAEWLVIPDGSVRPMPFVDFTAVCLLHDDGTYELVPVDSSEETFRTFLYAAQVACRLDGARDELIGDPLPIPLH